MHKVYVTIDQENFDKIKKTDKAFLLREFYPEYLEKQAKENELGLFFHMALIRKEDGPQ